jgi:hypothetical protein
MRVLAALKGQRFRVPGPCALNPAPGEGIKHVCEYAVHFKARYRNRKLFGLMFVLHLSRYLPF